MKNSVPGKGTEFFGYVRFCVWAILLLVHHEMDQLHDVVCLIGNEFQLGDLTAGEHIRKRYILGKLGFQIQAVALAGHEFNASAAAVDCLEKSFYICNVRDFHLNTPFHFVRPSDVCRVFIFLFRYSLFYCSFDRYLLFRYKILQFPGTGKTSENTKFSGKVRFLCAFWKGPVLQCGT